jgi:hypothetical protein
MRAIVSAGKLNRFVINRISSFLPFGQKRITRYLSSRSTGFLALFPFFRRYVFTAIQLNNSILYKFALSETLEGQIKFL